MKTWLENYGEDVDGNRGRLTRFYELEDSDTPEIIKQIKALAEPEQELMVVTLVCPETGEDIDFEIKVKDYV
jgi:hypothetical protein